MENGPAQPRGAVQLCAGAPATRATSADCREGLVRCYARPPPKRRQYVGIAFRVLPKGANVLVELAPTFQLHRQFTPVPEKRGLAAPLVVRILEIHDRLGQVQKGLWEQPALTQPPDLVHHEAPPRGEPGVLNILRPVQSERTYSPPLCSNLTAERRRSCSRPPWDRFLHQTRQCGNQPGRSHCLLPSCIFRTRFASRRMALPRCLGTWKPE